MFSITINNSIFHIKNIDTQNIKISTLKEIDENTEDHVDLQIVNIFLSYAKTKTSGDEGFPFLFFFFS